MYAHYSKYTIINPKNFKHMLIVLIKVLKMVRKNYERKTGVNLAVCSGELYIQAY